MEKESDVTLKDKLESLKGQVVVIESFLNKKTIKLFAICSLIPQSVFKIISVGADCFDAEEYSAYYCNSVKDFKPEHFLKRRTATFPIASVVKIET